MRIKKRGFHRKRGNFFRSKLVLNSLKSKSAFFVIVFLFGVVIVLAGMDVYENNKDEEVGLGERFDEEVMDVGLSPDEEILGEESKKLNFEENNFVGIKKKDLEAKKEWKEFNKKYGKNWDVRWNTETKIPTKLIGGNIEVFKFGIYKVTLENLDTLGRKFINENKDLFKIEDQNLRILKKKISDDLGVITYQQIYSNIPVYRGYVTLATKRNKIIMYKSSFFEDISIQTNPRINKNEATDKAKFYLKLHNTDPVSDTLIVYPSNYKYRLAYKIDFPIIKKPKAYLNIDRHIFFGDLNNENKRINYKSFDNIFSDINMNSDYLGDDNLYIKPTIFVDALNGEIIGYLDDIRYDSITGKVTGEIFPEYADDEQVEEPFAHEWIYANELQEITNGAGVYEINNLDEGNVNLNAYLEGPWAKVFNDQQNEAFHSTSLSVPTTHNWNWKDFDNSYKQEESNAFYHTNVIHDYITKPSLNVSEMNLQMIVNVNIPNSCNAYYDGSSINFFHATDECDSSALDAGIVYHEYGHGINRGLVEIDGVYWPYWCETGNMNEGFADYWACTIKNDSCAGNLFRGSCLRPCENTKRYPENYNCEPHSGAQIISGTFWDLREIYGADYVDKLVIDALRSQPMSFSELLENTLIADDDNEDLSDGTPNIEDICSAFWDNHGVYSSYCAGHTESPIALITYPNNNEVLSGIFNVTGTAYPSRYGLEDPNSFYYDINGNISTNPVVEDVLYTFNSLDFPEGKNELNLSVFDTQSTFSPSKSNTNIFIKNFEAISPLNYDIINPKDDLPIIIRNHFHIQVNDFSVFYSFEGGPWTNEGIIIEQSNEDDILHAYLQANTLNESGYFKIKALISHDDGIYEYMINEVYVDTTLKRGWPQKVYFKKFYEPHLSQIFKNVYLSNGYSEISSTDLNGDDKEEIVTYSSNIPTSSVLIYDLNGNLVNEIYFNVSYFSYTCFGSTSSMDALCVGDSLSYPLFVDLDKDGIDEIIVYSDNTTSLFVNAFKLNGQQVNGWPVEILHYNIWGYLDLPINPTIVASDLDFDGNVEIILQGDFIYEDRVIIIRRDGGIISNFAIRNNTDGWSFGGYRRPTPAIGNFDNDPELEIVVGAIDDESIKEDHANQRFFLSVYNIDGSLVNNNWPRLIPGIFGTSPIVGDLDNDGNDDILIGIVYEFIDPNESYGGLYVFNKNGELLNNGWPNFMGRQIQDTPSLFDNSNDGTLEIGITVGGVEEDYNIETYILDYQGNIKEGWPMPTSQLGTTYSSIFGDNKEVGLIQTDGDSTFSKARNLSIGGVFGWDDNGNEMAGFPKKTETFAYAPALLTDIDNDNLTDLITTSNLDYDPIYRKYKLRGSIYIWDTNFSYDNYEWPTFHHDKQLTGCYNCDQEQISMCSNSIIETGEQCDDGNTNNNDACTNQCLNNICGDGFVNSGVEQCDDGNTLDGDGCSASCEIETQTQCTSGADTNGNGIIDQGELNNYIQEYYIGDVNIDKLSNAIAEHLNGCV